MHLKCARFAFLAFSISLLNVLITGTVQASTPPETQVAGASRAQTEGRAIDPAGAEMITLQLGDAGSGNSTPLLPQAVSLALDDGSPEMTVGNGGTREFLFVNRFSPAPHYFPFTLKEIQVFFSSSSDQSASPKLGDDITLVVYQNTSGNADPGVGATLIAQFPATIKLLNWWNTYTLAQPVVIDEPGDLLIGVVAMETPGVSYDPAALDVTTSQGRSWSGWWEKTPWDATFAMPPDGLEPTGVPSWGLIDSKGNAGNWLIRAFGTTSNTFTFLPLVER